MECCLLWLTLYEPRHTKRALRVILMKNVYFSIFWIYIILRLICGILSKLAVKINFLRACLHGVYAATSLAASVTSRCLSNDIQNATSVILYINIIFIAKWLYGAEFQILHCSVWTMLKTFKPENTFKQTRVKFVYRENMTSFLNYVTSTLRVLFCVTRLIWCVDGQTHWQVITTGMSPCWKQAKFNTSSHILSFSIRLFECNNGIKML